MKRYVRAVAKSAFQFALRHRVPLPMAVRDRLRQATRAYFHRSRLFRHDSRHHFAPLALRVLHEGLIRTHPADFDIYNGRLRFRTSGSPMSTHGYYVGEFEFHLVRFLVDHLEQDALVLDIGAHHGEFAVPLAFEIKDRGWDTQVWSFEPDPQNVEFLRHNLAVNDLDGHAIVHEAAVSDGFHESAALLCPADNSSNTLAHNKDYAIGDEFPTARTTLVRTVAIDGLELANHRVGIVKLDIQGSEPEALRGAIAMLERDRPLLVVEVVQSWPRANEVKAILDDLGYVVRGLTAGGRLVPIDDPRVFVTWDWVAVPPGHRSLSEGPRSA